MRQRIWLGALALCLGACRPAVPATRHTIVLALQSSPTNLDPAVGLDESSQRVHSLLFSSLLRIDDRLRIVPDLATRFDTDDYRTYVAGIPPGVRFHDGREMTSADVAYTFRRFLDPGFVSGKKGAYQDLVAVDELDRYTVAFRLRGPSASFPASLTNMGIVPNGSGPWLARTPTGSGPYRFDAFAPDAQVTLKAFDAYYRGAPANGGITFKVVPDETMRGLELRKGDVDLIVNDLSPDLIHGLTQTADLAITAAPGTDYAYIGLNLRDPILRDLRVRQAIAHAIDRQAIVRYLRRDQARPTAGIVPEMSWAYAADIPTFHHDVERAKRLLDDAGYRDPDGDGPRVRLTLSLKTSTSEVYRVQAQALQQQLAAAGIGVELRSYEFATLFSDVIRGNVQLYTLIFTGGSVADPDILRRVFHSEQTPPSGFNRAHYANPDVDRLLDLASSSFQEAERRAAYIDAQRLIARDVPIVSLWTRTNIAIARSHLSGIRLSPIGDLEFLRDVRIGTMASTTKRDDRPDRVQ